MINLDPRAVIATNATAPPPTIVTTVHEDKVLAPRTPTLPEGLTQAILTNSYFSGAGLMDIGLQAGGLTLQQSFEIDTLCCETMKKFPVVMEAMTKLPDYYVHVRVQ